MKSQASLNPLDNHMLCTQQLKLYSLVLHREEGCMEWCHCRPGGRRRHRHARWPCAGWRRRSRRAGRHISGGGHLRGTPCRQRAPLFSFASWHPIIRSLLLLRLPLTEGLAGSAGTWIVLCTGNFPFQIDQSALPREIFAGALCCLAAMQAPALHASEEDSQAKASFGSPKVAGYNSGSSSCLQSVDISSCLSRIING